MYARACSRYCARVVVGGFRLGVWYSGRLSGRGCVSGKCAAVRPALLACLRFVASAQTAQQLDVLGRRRGRGKAGKRSKDCASLSPRAHTHTHVSDALFAQVEIAWRAGMWLAGWLLLSSACLSQGTNSPLQSRLDTCRVRCARSGARLPAAVASDRGCAGRGSGHLKGGWEACVSESSRRGSVSAASVQMRSCFLAR